MRRVLLAIAFAILALPRQAKAMPPHETVMVGKLAVAYTEEGPSNGTPMVLLHGGGLTSAMWQWFAPAAAAEGFHVYLPDTRNHGATNNPSGKFSYELAAKDLNGFLAALDIRDPILMGYSDGGIIAQTWLLTHPNGARAAIFGGSTNKVAADEHYMAGMKAFFGYGKRGNLPDSALDALEHTEPTFAARLKAMHATPSDPNRWRQLLKLAWPVWTTARVTPLSAYSAIKIPVLVILGQHDEFFRPQDAVALAEAMPKGEIAVIPGAHHPAFRDAAPLFDAIVLDFLKRTLVH